MKIFILVEDRKRRGGFEAEHGFSAYFEADGGTFLLWDDTALAIVGEEETILLAGCAHSGVVSIVAYADTLFPGRRTAILGGFHMRDFSRPDIDRILGELKRLGVARVYPGHCTGRAAITALLGSFAGERLLSGKIVDI